MLAAWLNGIGILLWRRYWQPSRWYFDPVFVTYTMVSRAGRLGRWGTLLRPACEGECDDDGRQNCQTSFEHATTCQRVAPCDSSSGRCRDNGVRLLHSGRAAIRDGTKHTPRRRLWVERGVVGRQIFGRGVAR